MCNLTLHILILLEPEIYKSGQKLGTSIMQDYYSLLGAIQKSSKLTVLLVDFNTPGRVVQLSRVFTTAGIEGMVEGKCHRNVNMVFR